MVYRCRECDERLDPGTAICVCGNVFPAPVPPANDDPGVVKWPPPAEPEGLQRNVVAASNAWENLSDSVKAGIAGAVVVLLIVLALVITHHK